MCTTKQKKTYSYLRNNIYTHDRETRVDIAVHIHHYIITTSILFITVVDYLTYSHLYQKLDADKSSAAASTFVRTGVVTVRGPPMDHVMVV